MAYYEAHIRRDAVLQAVLDFAVCLVDARMDLLSR